MEPVEVEEPKRPRPLVVTALCVLGITAIAIVLIILWR